MPMIPGWVRSISLYTVALAIVAGGIIHIAVTLLLPHLARASAFQRLADVLPINAMRVLPPADAAQQPIPYLGPDVRLAICRYDVSDGPVTLTMALPDKGWSLGLYTPYGDNFYILPAQEQRAGSITLTLVAAGERSFSLLTLGRPTAMTSISQVEVPAEAGFAVIRAPLRGRAFAGDVDSTLLKARCEVRRR